MRIRETIDWGIDLGTTNSSIAVFEGRDVKVIKNNDGDETTPSAVYEKKAGGSVIKRIGKTAKQKLKDDHEHVALEFKQKMGLKDWYFEFPSTGKRASAVDLSAEVISELVKGVKQRRGDDIMAALITVPAAFTNPTYEDTKKAGEQVGLSYVEVLEEPIAAALAYGLRPDVSSNVRWLAYDLGGGTFDTALVRVEDRIFHVFDHEGFPNLGGKDLDAAIVERYFFPELPTKIKEKIIPWKSQFWWLLKFMAEEAKCQLSTNDKYTIDVKIDGYDFVYDLTGGQLGKLETELFAQTIEKCRDLLGRNGFKSGDIEKVVLIGGPTLSPRLRKMIEEGLGIPIDFSEDPLTAVACGAAIYAAGRKIPDDPLKKIREIEGSVIEAAVHGNLRYPSTTREEEVMVAGRLEPKDKSLTISSEWSVEIKRINKAGEVEWSGGRISVADNGGFSKVVQLEKGENLFRLVVINAQGREVKSDRADFTVIKTEVEAAPPHLPRGIGVADKYGDVIWFFEKGKPLPAEKSIVLATTKKLIRGEKGEAISIPVVEGNEKKAHLNREIYKLKVEADKVLTNIPEGSSVEVTIQIDESRSIEVEAFLEDYDVEASATNPSMLDIKPEQLHDDLKKLQQVISSLTDVASEDREVNHVVEEVNKSGLIDDIEKLISQISKENPEPAQQAMDKILKLRKKLDPVIEKGNELIKWKPHREWCDKNIRTAKNIVREVGDLPSDWQGQFDHLLSDYADAVREKDFRRTEELAYGTLPDLFLSSEALRERVGGSGLQKPETPGIYDGGGLKKGDVKR